MIRRQRIFRFVSRRQTIRIPASMISGISPYTQPRKESKMIVPDLSNNNSLQGHAFVTMKTQGHAAAVYLKCTEGHSFTDPNYADWRTAAKAAGLHVGAYHFARPAHNSPESEAAFFLSKLGRLFKGDLRPALDLEVEEIHGVTEWARAFNHTVRAKLGVYPVFYSYPDYIAHMGATYPIGDGLWLASYGRNDGKRYPYVVPKP